MKFLCFSDLHCDQAAARKLVRKANEADILLGAGDFAKQHRGLADTLDILAAIDRPAILVPGNGETAEELTDAAAVWRSAVVLHGAGCTINQVAFWGVGGGIPVTPFGDWSYDFDEKTALGLLQDCPRHGVLVVHSPPLDTVDHDSTGRIRGSSAIREIILQRQPRLVVCGHIHSSWQQQTTLGETLILNAGPEGVLLDVAGEPAQS